MSKERCRELLQYIYEDPSAGGKWRKELEAQLKKRAEELKEPRRKPNGDFVKIRVTNKLWGVVNLRNLLREEEVKKVHPRHVYP